MSVHTLFTFKQIETNLHQYTKEEQDQIKSAFLFAKKVHANQTRVSGEPYISHPLSVANIVVTLGLDSPSVVSALLHDVVEDSSTTINLIEDRFGKEVAQIVNGLTKLSALQLIPQQQIHTQNLVHLFVNMTQDHRVMIIKLADRLHNVSTLDSIPREKQLRIVDETVSLYIPLAEKLGIHWIAQNLEEFSYRHKDPLLYSQIKSYVIQQLETGQLQRIEQATHELLQQHQLYADVYARIKSIPSLYKKIIQDLKPVEEIYDLFGLRIICKSEKDCYIALGIIHKKWSPLDGRFKDYIALPKTNGYRSLHSTVLGPDGRSLEVQIRTQEMHETAESGVAAHWKYKKKNIVTIGNSPFGDISALKDAGKQDPHYLDEIQHEALQDRLTTFTPVGDPINLPLGSTALDFAFKIHTEIGLHAMAARINGTVVRLAEPLTNTDVVEIITTKTSHPHINWVYHVKTSHARSRIAHWINNNEKNSIVQGKIIAHFDYPKICKYFNKTVLSLSLKTAQCCTINPSVVIQAILKKNQTIEVHAHDCKQIQKNRRTPFVSVSWITSASLHTVQCTIHLQNTDSIYARIEKIATGIGIRLQAILIRDTERGQVDALCTFTHPTHINLEKLRQALRTIPSFVSMHYLGTKKAITDQNQGNIPLL